MEVIAIQKSSFEKLFKAIQELLISTQTSTAKYSAVLGKEKWLDNQEVCLMLGISKRTLQTYTQKKLLPCSKISRKNYYRYADVQALLTTLKTNKQ
jgi:hypothetical protein